MAPPRHALLALAARVQALDIRVIERVEDDVAREAFVSRVVEVVRDAEAECRRLAQAHGGADASPSAAGGRPKPELDTDAFMLALDAAVAESAGASKVADVAFMAALELGQRRRRLEQPPPPDPWDRVAECGSALRRVTKSLSAIDLALAEVDGTPARLAYHSQLETALKTRRLYRKLWTFAEREPEPKGVDQVRSQLRGAGTLIAMMVGRDEYTRLRVNDRRRLRELQNRILAWLVQEAPDARSGARTWADFAAFASMLRAISHRQELVEHDRRLLTSAWALMGAQVVPDAMVALLRPVEGLDPHLDEVLGHPAPTVARLRAVLESLCQRLGLLEAPAAGSPPAEFL